MTYWTAGYPYTFPILWIWPPDAPFQIQVLVAFASDPFDAAPVWTDITRDVQNITIKRGRQTELARMEAGTATIQLKNHQGNYWPNNASGAYFPNVLPGKKVQIRATYAGVPYYLYTGFAAGWPPKWLSKTGGQNPIVSIKCVDLIKNMSNFDLNTVGYAQEASGTRVDNVLDDIAWPAGLRAVDPGQETIQASGAIADEKAMTHLFLVQDSEYGIFYIAGNGDVTFEDRAHRFVAPHTVSQAIFGDDLGENYYADLVPEYDDEFIFNDIRITRDGGTQQVETDAASKTAYGTRTHSKTGLLMLTDPEAKDQAGYKLRLYKDPVLRARSLKILGARDPDRLWPKVLGYDISTRITVRRNEASMDEDYFIEGVSHQIDLQNLKWQTSWQLSNATDQMFWILGLAGYSEMGETTWLAW
ncbi:hypothetical protein LCGC14_0970800 [marine sediment metagenome]|uniref:Uncharacterized protein n=1 Tax=marine sediment metagenome TaxID=412755 RepID=A0A0F9RI64_9ZZZZ